MRTAFNPLGVGDMAKDYIIDYGNNSNGWYRKWKSGFIEQWGNILNGAVSNRTTVSLPISFSSTNYIIQTTGNSTTISTGESWNYVTISSINQFIASSRFGTFYWYACGY